MADEERSGGERGRISDQKRWVNVYLPVALVLVAIVAAGSLIAIIPASTGLQLWLRWGAATIGLMLVIALLIRMQHRSGR